MAACGRVAIGGRIWRKGAGQQEGEGARASGAAQPEQEQALTGPRARQGSAAGAGGTADAAAAGRAVWAPPPVDPSARAGRCRRGRSGSEATEAAAARPVTRPGPSASTGGAGSHMPFLHLTAPGQTAFAHASTHAPLLQIVPVVQVILSQTGVDALAVERAAHRAHLAGAAGATAARRDARALVADAARACHAGARVDADAQLADLPVRAGDAVAATDAGAPLADLPGGAVEAMQRGSLQSPSVSHLARARRGTRCRRTSECRRPGCRRVGLRAQAVAVVDHAVAVVVEAVAFLGAALMTAGLQLMPAPTWHSVTPLRADSRHPRVAGSPPPSQVTPLMSKTMSLKSPSFPCQLFCVGAFPVLEREVVRIRVRLRQVAERHLPVAGHRAARARAPDIQRVLGVVHARQRRLAEVLEQHEADQAARVVGVGAHVGAGDDLADQHRERSDLIDRGGAVVEAPVAGTLYQARPPSACDSLSTSVAAKSHSGRKTPVIGRRVRRLADGLAVRVEVTLQTDLAAAVLANRARPAGYGRTAGRDRRGGDRDAIGLDHGGVRRRDGEDGDGGLSANK